MDDYTGAHLLSLQTAELTGRTPFCPEDREIAEYFDGVATAVERIRLENHLAGSRFCLGRIGMLQRLQDDSADVRVPEDVLATAKAMRQGPLRRYPRASAWVAAAAVLIAVVSVVSNNPLQVSQRGVKPTAVLPPHAVEPQLRNISRAANDLDVLSPAPGTVVTRGSRIRWNPVSDNAHYRIFVLSSAGDVLWRESLQGTEWIVPDELDLPAGDEFFFRVEAELPAGNMVSSRHLVLRAANGQ